MGKGKVVLDENLVEVITEEMVEKILEDFVRDGILQKRIEDGVTYYRALKDIKPKIDSK